MKIENFQILKEGMLYYPAKKHWFFGISKCNFPALFSSSNRIPMPGQDRGWDRMESVNFKSEEECRKFIDKWVELYQYNKTSYRNFEIFTVIDRFNDSFGVFLCVKVDRKYFPHLRDYYTPGSSNETNGFIYCGNNVMFDLHHYSNKKIGVNRFNSIEKLKSTVDLIIQYYTGIEIQSASKVITLK